MCGIVGLFIKNPELEPRLGALLAPMLAEMSERGPDSAGVAVYRDPAPSGGCKITLQQTDGTAGGGWSTVENSLRQRFGTGTRLHPRANHAVAVLPTDAAAAQVWLAEQHPELNLTSVGASIEIYKDKGLPQRFIDTFALHGFAGSHAVAHTRMATESAVTTEHSHPFSTGQDLCLVHNGSLSNHNRLRQRLRRQGVSFQTDNDSEVAAGYLMWRQQQGDDLDQALRHALNDLDGFYTFAVGSRDGFAVLRDPFGCKPAVLAENDDWAAMASEFRAIATLPGVEQAAIWEPVPEKIYSWSRH